MGFNAALSHFSRNAENITQASGSGYVAQSTSKYFSGLKRASIFLLTASIMGLSSPDAIALNIEESAIAQMTQEAGVNYRLFNDPEINSFAISRQEVNEDFWKEMETYRPNIIQDKSYGMSSGDIGINRMSTYFKGIPTVHFPIFFNLAEGGDYSDEALAGQASSIKMLNAFTRYKSIHNDVVSELSDKGDLDQKNLSRHQLQMEDSFVINAIALHYGANADDLSRHIDRYVVEHELGHAAIMHDVSIGTPEGNVVHEYAAELHGLIQTLSHIAKETPDQYEATSQALISAVTMSRLLVSPDGQHIGAAYAAEQIHKRLNQGDLTLAKMQVMTRDKSVLAMKQLVGELPAGSLVEEAKKFTEHKGEPFIGRFMRFNWIGDAAEKYVANLGNKSGSDYQDVVAKYQNTEHVSIAGRVDKFRSNALTHQPNPTPPYQFGH